MKRLNGLADFSRWIFFSGMRFAEENLWWGACKKRLSIHEGLDILAWEGADGKIRRLAAGALVPAMAGGVVRHVGPDFLGHSIWMELGEEDGRGNVCHLVYAHVDPSPSVLPGRAVRCGEVVAAVAGTRDPIPAHLHISLVWLARSIVPEMLVWEKMADAGARFIDPLPLFEGDYRMGNEGEKPW